MPDLRGHITPQGNLSGTLNTIVYADNYNVLENKPSINSVTLQGNKTASDLGLAVPADITVTSVNGETGDVVLDGSDINYDANTTINNKIDDIQSQIEQSGVLAVNGKTGVVTLTGSDINYSAGVTLNSKIDAVEAEIPTVSYPVTSVNTKTGAVVLDGTDIKYDNNTTINAKIDAVEAEIPTVDYPVTSVNGETGEVVLTIPTDAGDLPLGSDFSDPTSTAYAINSMANSPLVSKTHCKYIQLPSKVVFIIVDGATNAELLDIPLPSSTQYFAGLSQSNTYAAFSLSATGKVTIITSGATSVYGNFVYYSA